MRRLRVELPLDDFVRLKGGGGGFYRALESFVVLQTLRAGPEGATSIVRIRPKDPSVRFETIARMIPGALQLLDREDGTYTCLMKIRPSSEIHRQLGLKRNPGFLVPPLEVENERARITFVGSASDIARFLASLRSRGYRHRVVSISDYRLAPNSPLNALTDQQRRVVCAAYEEGYYDRPRRVSSKALAGRLGLSSSTFVNHRLKAERRLLGAILGQEPSARGGPALLSR